MPHMIRDKANFAPTIQHWLKIAASHALPEQVWLRFVTGRPVSALTTHFLDWAATKLAALGK